MHIRVKSIFTGLLVIASLLSGCATPVLVDYDQAAVPKFAEYKCFVIDNSDNPGVRSGDLALSPIAARRFERKIEAALKVRGFTGDCAKPDFHVQFNTARKSFTRLDFNYPNYATHFHYNHFHPSASFFSPPYIDRYEEVTFLVDIIDAQSKEIVWRGTYVERLRRRPHKDGEVHAIIDQILDQFPPQVESDSD